MREEDTTPQRGPLHDSGTASIDRRVRPARTPAPATIAARDAGTLPLLVAQPHGGALLRGGVPGNRGGDPAQLTKGKIRARLRAMFDENLPVAEATLNDPNATRAEKLAALGLLAQYGLGKPPAVKRSHRERVTKVEVIYRDELPTDRPDDDAWADDAPAAHAGAHYPQRERIGDCEVCWIDDDDPPPRR